jgi:peroxiredoxin
MLKEGETAPDFELQGFHDGGVERYRLSDYTDAGNWVVVTFYAFDFNPVCTEGVCSLRDAEFLQFEDDLSVLGVSGDGIHAHEQFAEQYNINYPLLSDTGRNVGEAYGVVHDNYEGMDRVHQRSLFLVDPDRTVRLALAIEADDPADVDVEPVVGMIREARGN